MTTQSDTEALKALVELSHIRDKAISDQGMHEGPSDLNQVEEAFEAALEAALPALERLLASPDANRQEPVAWMYGRRPTAEHPYEHGQTWSLTRRYDLPGWIEIPLYAHPFPSHDAIMAAADEIGKLFQLRWGRRFEEPVMPQEIEAIIRKHLGKRGDK